MSYNVSFQLKVEGVDYYMDTNYCDANITWNVRDIIVKSTGLEWINESNNGFVKDIIPHIKEGLEELSSNGDKYRQYEPSNGFGSVEGVIRFFTKILDSWDMYLGSLSYLDSDVAEKIKNLVTFWIE